MTEKQSTLFDKNGNGVLNKANQADTYLHEVALIQNRKLNENQIQQIHKSTGGVRAARRENTTGEIGGGQDMNENVSNRLQYSRLALPAPSMRKKLYPKKDFLNSPDFADRGFELALVASSFFSSLPHKPIEAKEVHLRNALGFNNRLEKMSQNDREKFVDMVARIGEFLHFQFVKQNSEMVNIQMQKISYNMKRAFDNGNDIGTIITPKEFELSILREMANENNNVNLLSSSFIGHGAEEVRDEKIRPYRDLRILNLTSDNVRNYLNEDVITQELKGNSYITKLNINLLQYTIENIDEFIESENDRYQKMEKQQRIVNYKVSERIIDFDLTPDEIAVILGQQVGHEFMQKALAASNIALSEDMNEISFVPNGFSGSIRRDFLNTTFSELALSSNEVKGFDVYWNNINPSEVLKDTHENLNAIAQESGFMQNSVARLNELSMGKLGNYQAATPAIKQIQDSKTLSLQEMATMFGFASVNVGGALQRNKKEKDGLNRADDVRVTHSLVSSLTNIAVALGVPLNTLGSITMNNNKLPMSVNYGVSGGTQNSLGEYKESTNVLALPSGKIGGLSAAFLSILDRQLFAEANKTKLFNNDELKEMNSWYKKSFQNSINFTQKPAMFATVVFAIQHQKENLIKRLREDYPDIMRLGEHYCMSVKVKGREQSKSMSEVISENLEYAQNVSQFNSERAWGLSLKDWRSHITALDNKVGLWKRTERFNTTKELLMNDNREILTQGEYNILREALILSDNNVVSEWAKKLEIMPFSPIDKVDNPIPELKQYLQEYTQKNPDELKFLRTVGKIISNSIVIGLDNMGNMIKNAVECSQDLHTKFTQAAHEHNQRLAELQVRKMDLMLDTERTELKERIQAAYSREQEYGDSWDIERINKRVLPEIVASVDYVINDGGKTFQEMYAENVADLINENTSKLEKEIIDLMTFTKDGKTIPMPPESGLLRHLCDAAIRDECLNGYSHKLSEQHHAPTQYLTDALVLDRVAKMGIIDEVMPDLSANNQDFFILHDYHKRMNLNLNNMSISDNGNEVSLFRNPNVAFIRIGEIALAAKLQELGLHDNYLSGGAAGLQSPNEIERKAAMAAYPTINEAAFFSDVYQNIAQEMLGASMDWETEIKKIGVIETTYNITGSEDITRHISPDGAVRQMTLAERKEQRKEQMVEVVANDEVALKMPEKKTPTQMLDRQLSLF